MRFEREKKRATNEIGKMAKHIHKVRDGGCEREEREREPVENTHYVETFCENIEKCVRVWAMRIGFYYYYYYFFLSFTKRPHFVVHVSQCIAPVVSSNTNDGENITREKREEKRKKRTTISWKEEKFAFEGTSIRECAFISLSRRDRFLLVYEHVHRTRIATLALPSSL